MATVTRIGPLPEPFWLLDVRVDPAARTLTRARGESMRVSPRAIQVLLALSRHPGRTLSHDALIDAVWGPAVVGDEVLFKAVSELRGALGDSARAPRLIATIPKTGYRLLQSPRSAPPRRDLRFAAVGVLVLALAGLSLGIAPDRGITEADRLWRKASFVLEREDAGGVDRALRWLRRAIAVDAGHGPAQALLAETLLKHRNDWLEARTAADAALNAAPDHTAALLVRARIALEYEWDWDRARRLIDRAQRADPGNPMVQLALATWHATRGDHPAAHRAARRALELDPVDPVVKGDLAFFYFLAGRTEEMFVEVRRLRELEPTNRFARALEIEALLRSGAPPEVRPLLARALTEQGVAAEEAARLARVPANELEIRYLKLVRGHLGATEPERAMQLASLDARIGDTERALDELARAVAERSPYLPFVPVDPHFAPLREHPRYAAIMAATGHPLAPPIPAETVAAAAAP